MVRGVGSRAWWGIAVAVVGVTVLAGCGTGSTADPGTTVTATITVTAPAPSSTPTPLPTPIPTAVGVTASVGGQPLANATVQVYSATSQAPLTVGVTDLNGAVDLSFDATADAALYVTTRGGQVGQGRAVSAPVELVSLIGTARPATVVVDERTTVAAAYTAAEVVKADGQVQASPEQIDAAAVAAAGLVDPVTGQLGPNGQTQAATINTLANAVTACSGREPMCQALTITSSGAEPQNAATTFAGLAATARDPARGAGSIFAVQQGYTTFSPALEQPPQQFVIDY